jgi:hypothetical protein
MPDGTFDAVIIGGGTKALFLTMYLTKYTNMSVGLLPFNIVLHIKRQYLYKQLSRKLL